MESHVVKILHFSDIFCVWAYVGHVRIDELERTFGDQVSIECHFLDVYGDMRTKIDVAAAAQGGVQAYADNLRANVSQFDHVALHPDVWTKLVPSSSMACHVFLRAVDLVAKETGNPSVFRKAIWMARERFFKDLVDVSTREAQLAMTEELGLSVDAIWAHIQSGRAHAALSQDHARAREFNVTMSPTVVFNEGRQQLRGNVGYRVHEANVRELLDRRPRGASWC